MWSVKHTGSSGVVPDAFHRLCVRLTVEEFLQRESFLSVEELVRLPKHRLRHLLLEVDLKDRSVDYHSIRERCEALRAMTRAEERLVFTCEVSNYERDNQGIKDVMESIQPSVILLKKCSNRNKTLHIMKYLVADTNEMILEREKAQEDSPTYPLALGVSGLEPEERQYVLDDQRGTVRAMCLGTIRFPNVQSCAVELLHSRNCNAYLTIDDLSEDHLSGLSKFEKKYSRPAGSVLVKILLELGAIVCIDWKLVSGDTFRSHILRLAHPFTHLQVERAPTDEYHFVLPREELNFLISKSQEVELAEEEELIKNVYTVMPDVRVTGA